MLHSFVRHVSFFRSACLNPTFDLFQMLGHCFREGMKPSPTLAVIGGRCRYRKKYVEHCFRKGMKPFPA